nr:MAG TPA: hypothetical protein [Herelleviridae sp.]
MSIWHICQYKNMSIRHIFIHRKRKSPEIKGFQSCVKKL